MEVVLCGLIGRLSLIQLLFLSVGGLMSYSFTQVINIVVTRARTPNAYILDVGGAMDIFLWAGVFGLTIGYGMRKKYTNLKEKYRAMPENDNPMLALIGTAFLWAGFMFVGHSDPKHQTELDLAPMNTVLALSSSVLTTYMMSTWIHFKMGIYESVMSTISGGIIIGSCGSIAENPTIALTLGAFSGILTYVLIHFAFQRINARWMVMSHDIFSVFVVNGFLSGAASSMILAAYIKNPLSRTLFTGSQFSTTNGAADCTYQIIHLGVTIILALFGGLLVSGLINCFMSEQTSFLDDFNYFEEEFSLGDGGWVMDENRPRREQRQQEAGPSRVNNNY